MPHLPANQLSRAARLAALPTDAAAARALGTVRRLAGQDRDEIEARLTARKAERTVEVLGDLKGVALKVGQFLSTVDAVLYEPDSPWRAALQGLQEGTHALPFPVVQSVLVDELGPDWHRMLRQLDPTPVAAASLGQVHRAVWGQDGRHVAVKIQYPGVREAVRADLRNLAATLRVLGLSKRAQVIRPLVAELRRRLLEELDYVREGESQQRFADAYAEDEQIVVPGVAWASPRVLVTDWVTGGPLVERTRTADQATRDRLGAAYLRFLLSGPRVTGLLHADPHGGNFFATDDGRLGVLDFGAVLVQPGGWPRSFGRLISIVLRGEEAGILRGLHEERFVRGDAHVDAADLAGFLAPFAEPADSEYFTFSSQWLRSVFRRSAGQDEREVAVLSQLTLPPEQLLAQRVWLGGVGVLCQLDATVAARAQLVRWLPGFVPA